MLKTCKVFVSENAIKNSVIYMMISKYTVLIGLTSKQDNMMANIQYKLIYYIGPTGAKNARSPTFIFVK